MSFNNRNRVLPIGVVFCYTHLKEEEAKKEDKATEQPVNTSPIPSSTPVDEDFLLVQISLSNGTISTATETATSLCSALKVQWCIISRKNVSVNQVKIQSKSWDKNSVACKKKLESQFAEAIAPAQSEEFIEDIIHSNTEEGKQKPSLMIFKWK